MKRCAPWLLVVLTASRALAQDAPADPMAEAKRLYGEGKRYYDVADYPHAIDAWKRAYLISSAPMLLFNIAQAYRLAGNCPDALRMYASYEHEEPNPSNHDDLEQAKGRCIREPTKTHDPMAPEPTPPVVTVHPAPTPAPVEDSRSNLRIAGIATGAAGVVLGVTSLVFAHRASNDADQVSHYTGEWTTTQQALDDSGRSSRDVALVTGITASAALVTGAALCYFGWREPRRSHVEMSLAPTRTEVLWSVTF